MNLMSLVLYTSAFSLIIFRTNIYYFSLDKYFNIDTLFTNKRQTTISMPSNKEKLLSKS
jgi:thiosulfate dehydrogenase (quinone) large subunit